jgi:uncharacterized phiE125 gp8 family phage protein
MTRRLDPYLVTGPTLPAVHLAEIKLHLRVDDDDRDLIIQDLIDSAIAHYDGWTGVQNLCLVNQTWAQKLEFLSAIRIPLTLGPVSSITHIKYYDTDNALQTLSSSVYRLQKRNGTAYVELIEGQSWPSVYSRDDAVIITYVCGYGAASSDVPADIRAAIKLHVEAAHESPDATDVDRLEAAQDRLVMKYRRIGF